MRAKHDITFEMNQFMIDRRSRDLSAKTIRHYKSQLLELFKPWLDSQDIKTVDEITPAVIRQYLLFKGEVCKANTVRNAFVCVRIFLNWYVNEYEYELGDWHNPIDKVKKPKTNKDPLPGYDLELVNALISTCGTTKEADLRDKAMFLVLIDTGLRMEELEMLTVGDVNMSTGLVRVKHGKGDKGRDVFVKAKVLKDLSRYLRSRGRLADDAPLFASVYRPYGFLSKSSMNTILKERATKAGVVTHGYHSFRRGFTIEMLRSGADILSISRLLGHSSLNMVSRYAAQNSDDLRRVHEKFAPSDKL
jgi:site-specific recombinase XerD